MKLAETYKQRFLDELCRFVRIPSRSSAKGGEEGQLQLVVAELMRQAGARVRTFEADDVDGFYNHPLCSGPERNYKNRPTVIGQLGPEDAPALLVLAHSDTVQITRPEDWTFDPFCGEIHDDRICGLGSSDDKWGTATMVTIIRALRDSGRDLKKKLIFASTIDEENGISNGTVLLMLAGVKAQAALYLDGYQMNVFVGNMGGAFLYFRPRKALARDVLAGHIKQVSSACQKLSKRRSGLFTQRFFENNATRERSVILHERSDEEGPFFIVNFYTLPGEDKAVFRAELEGVLSESLGEDLSAYAMNYDDVWFEPSVIPEDTAMIGYVAESVREIVGKEARITTISKQDNFVLNNYAHIPTVSFGVRGQFLGRGAAHEVDEYVTIDEAWNGCQVAYSAICRWLQEDI